MSDTEKRNVSAIPQRPRFRIPSEPMATRAAPWFLALALAACGASSGESELFSNGPADAGHESGDGSGNADSGAEDGAAPMVCAPGQSVGCVGPGGCQGGQACRDDGSGFEACECGAGGGGASDAGPDAPPDTSSWQWWCTYAPASNTREESCSCIYGVTGTGGENVATCPKSNCCYRQQQGGVATKCTCIVEPDSIVCSARAGSSNAVRVSACP